MIKENQVKAGVTRCDHCSEPSVQILPDGVALCAKHLDPAKKAEKMQPALKSVAGSLSERLSSRS